MIMWALNKQKREFIGTDKPTVLFFVEDDAMNLFSDN
jgi:hypothetical protein